MSKKLISVLLISVMLLLLPLISCKKDDNEEIQGNEIGDICYTKDLRVIDENGYTGENISCKSTRGKVTIINFWGTWCGYCVYEMPDFDKIARLYSDSVSIIAVHTYSQSSSVPSFLIEQGYADSNIIFAVDDSSDGYNTSLGGGNAWPYTVVLDENGVIVSKHTGMMSYDRIMSEINEAKGNN